MPMKIAEPDVTLSDFALSVESAIFALLIAIQPAAKYPVQDLFVVFFLAITIASLCGGVVHGFLTTPDSRWQNSVWRIALVALGAAAVASWAITAWVALHGPWSTILVIAAVLLYLIYVFVVVFVHYDYRVAIVHYVPALLALAFTFFRSWMLHGTIMLLVGVAGIALALAAGVMQQNRIGIHPVYFSYNALYHLNQGIAMFAIFLGARALVLGK
jgi:hypothetical protein